MFVRDNIDDLRKNSLLNSARVVAYKKNCRIIINPMNKSRLIIMSIRGTSIMTC